MKRAKTLILLVGVFAVLFCGYLVLSYINDSQQTEDDGLTQRIELPNISSDSLSEITWTYGGESYTIVLNSDGTWSYPADSAFPLSQTIAEDMKLASTSVFAIKQLDEVSNLSEYGLEPPVLVVTTSGNGETITYNIGENNSVAEGYYMMVEGDPNLYISDPSISDVFSKTLLEVVQKESIPEVKQMQSFTITSDKGEFDLYHDGIAWYDLSLGTEGKLDSDKVSSLVTNITGLAWINCVAYNADDEALEEYGLLEPALTVDVSHVVTKTEETGEYDENGEPIKKTSDDFETFKVSFGNVDGTLRYARLDDSRIVYQVNSSVYDNLYNANAESLMAEDTAE